MTFNFAEKYRIEGEKGEGGAFRFPPHTVGKTRRELLAVASNNKGWHHVSVSGVDRGKSVIPTWEEMCAVKDLFFGAEDCVLQYHPPKSEYVNVCKFCLHLWQPIGVSFPRPHKSLVF